MPKISVTEAAARMGVTPMFLRMGLRLGRFPFGTAVKMPGGRWSYYINPVRFERYMQGLDMGGGDEDARGADEPPRPDGGGGRSGGQGAPTPAPAAGAVPGDVGRRHSTVREPARLRRCPEARAPVRVVSGRRVEEADPRCVGAGSTTCWTAHLPWACWPGSATRQRWWCTGS